MLWNLTPISFDRACIRSLGVAAFSLVALLGTASAQNAGTGLELRFGDTQVFCETSVQNNALGIVCSSGNRVHLVVRQRAGGLVACPTSGLGRRINDQAYGYSVDGKLMGRSIRLGQQSKAAILSQC